MLVNIGEGMKKIFLLILMLASISAMAQENIFKPESQQSLNNFASSFIKDGATQTLKGKNANPFLLKNVVTATKVIADYKANQLKANKTYEEKYTRIQTVASSIDAGILNTPFIVANGKNQFENIIIYINPTDDRFLDINAGDKIDLICKGKGYKIMSPAFGDCMFTKDYIEKASPIILNNIQKASNKGYEPSSLEEAKILLAYLMFEPLIKNDCEISEEACTKKYKSKDLKEPEPTEQLKSFINFFKGKNIKSILYQF